MNTPTLKIIDDPADLPAQQWDALAGDDPFLTHHYLSALQNSGCTAPQFGWQAQFLTLWEGEQLLGGMPMYLKMNSYGEHVFDFAWADAYHRNGLRYYPKLLNAVPFTPVTGRRLLGITQEVRELMLKSALQFARDVGVSSLHCLFPDESDRQIMQQQGMLLRQDVQFHWQNHGYQDFEEFLASLSRDKRKRIKQERRKVHEAGIQVECILGIEATAEQWSFFASCYARTRQMHHSPPALNETFFHAIGATMPQNVLLVIASRKGRMIASAMNIVKHDVLYGRSWGAFEFHSGLHFETCYYRAIEFCIEHNIRTFEGGAQGEHKLARGFLPVATHSAHWLAHAKFSHAIEVYLQQESGAVREYMEELNQRNPFKQRE